MNLDKLAQQQRAEILRREQQLANRIDSEYAGLWRSLARKLLRLLDTMKAAEQAAKAAGLSFNAYAWIHQIRRLDLLLAAVQTDMESFTETARSQIDQQRLPAWQLGEESALKLMKASLPPGLDVEFGRPSQRAFDLLSQRQYQFARMTPEAILAVRKRLLSGLVLGQGPREVAASIQQGVKNVSRNRALIIAREELINPYRAAALMAYQENDDVVEEWKWITAEDERTCPLCRPLDGKHFPLSASFQAPHLGCRCTPGPVTYDYDTILARFAA